MLEENVSIEQAKWSVNMPKIFPNTTSEGNEVVKYVTDSGNSILTSDHQKTSIGEGTKENQVYDRIVKFAVCIFFLILLPLCSRGFLVITYENPKFLLHTSLFLLDCKFIFKVSLVL